MKTRGTTRLPETFSLPQFIKGVLGVFAASFVTLVPCHAQNYEITPIVGGMFGGTWQLEQQGTPNFEAHLRDRLTYGIVGGVRFDGDDCEECDFIGFRWMRQHTHLFIDQDPEVSPSVVSPFHPAVVFDNYLGDFSHEWRLKESRFIRPFVTASLGAAHISTPAGSSTKFMFGFSTGLNVFPKPRWGFRVQVEYLPIVKEAELQRVICAGGCIVALNGGVMNQFVVGVGPSFRF